MTGIICSNICKRLHDLLIFILSSFAPTAHAYLDHSANSASCRFFFLDEKMIKLMTNLENMCSVVMEESESFSEDEKPLNSTKRRRGGHLQGDIKRHTCSRCSKSYIHAWHLKRHTKIECGQEPRVQCPYCSTKMKQRGHVYRHIRQCHRGQNVYVIDLN